MSFTCSICLKVFTLKSNLKKHIASANNNKNMSARYARNRVYEKIIYEVIDYMFTTKRPR